MTDTFLNSSRVLIVVGLYYLNVFTCTAVCRAGDGDLVARRAPVASVHAHRPARLPSVVAARSSSSRTSVSGLRRLRRAAGLRRARPRRRRRSTARAAVPPRRLDRRAGGRLHRQQRAPAVTDTSGHCRQHAADN